MTNLKKYVSSYDTKGNRIFLTLLIIYLGMIYSVNADSFLNVGLGFSTGFTYSLNPIKISAIAGDVFIMTNKAGSNTFNFNLDTYADLRIHGRNYSLDGSYSEFSCGDMPTNPITCYSNAGIYRLQFFNSNTLYLESTQVTNNYVDYSFRNFTSGSSIIIPLVNMYSTQYTVFFPASFNFYSTNNTAIYTKSWDVSCLLSDEIYNVQIINSLNSGNYQYYYMSSYFAAHKPIDFLTFSPYPLLINSNLSTEINFNVIANYPDEIDGYAWYIDGDYQASYGTTNNSFRLNTALLGAGSHEVSVQIENIGCYEFKTLTWNLICDNCLSSTKYEGYVYRNNTQTIIENAQVTLIDSDFNYNTIYTNSLGKYSFSGIHNGTYTLRVKKDGYLDYFKSGIIVLRCQNNIADNVYLNKLGNKNFSVAVQLVNKEYNGSIYNDNNLSLPFDFEYKEDSLTLISIYNGNLYYQDSCIAGIDFGNGFVHINSTNCYGSQKYYASIEKDNYQCFSSSALKCSYEGFISNADSYGIALYMHDINNKQNYSVYGNIKNDNLDNLSGAKIELFGMKNYYTYSDSSGNYNFTSVNEGEYNYKVTKVGFIPYTYQINVISNYEKNVIMDRTAGMNLIISGIITDCRKGLPLQNVKIRFTDLSNISYDGFTNEIGMFSVVLNRNNYSIYTQFDNYGYGFVKKYDIMQFLGDTDEFDFCISSNVVMSIVQIIVNNDTLLLENCKLLNVSDLSVMDLSFIDSLNIKSNTEVILIPNGVYRLQCNYNELLTSKYFSVSGDSTVYLTLEKDYISSENGSINNENDFINKINSSEMWTALYYLIWLFIGYVFVILIADGYAALKGKKKN